MLNVYSRTYSIVHTAVIAGLVALFLNYLSGIYIRSGKEFKGEVRHVNTHELILDRSQCDRAAIEIYLKYDLRETFDWSTHLLFLYVTASYETAKHQRNELIIHDKIIKTEEEAYEPGSNVIAKYYMVDYARGLRNKKIKLELHYDFVPIGGFMHKNKLSESYFSFPSAYIKYKGNR